jgi:hypothetical protein
LRIASFTDFGEILGFFMFRRRYHDGDLASGYIT